MSRKLYKKKPAPRRSASGGNPLDYRERIGQQTVIIHTAIHSIPNMQRYAIRRHRRHTGSSSRKKTSVPGSLFGAAGRGRLSGFASNGSMR
jgi:hypothetical protein